MSILWSFARSLSSSILEVSPLIFVWSRVSLDLFCALGCVWVWGVPRVLGALGCWASGLAGQERGRVMEEGRGV